MIPAALPEAIDLLTLVMQAGLDFQVALSHYLDRAPLGPLREELGIVQSEIRTGLSRIDALRHLCDRVPDHDVRETARAIIQGIEMGSSLTPILRRASARPAQTPRFRSGKACGGSSLKTHVSSIRFYFPNTFCCAFWTRCLDGDERSRPMKIQRFLRDGLIAALAFAALQSFQAYLLKEAFDSAGTRLGAPIAIRCGRRPE